MTPILEVRHKINEKCFQGGPERANAATSFTNIKVFMLRPVRRALSRQRLQRHAWRMIVQTVIVAKSSNPLVVH